MLPSEPPDSDQAHASIVGEITEHVGEAIEHLYEQFEREHADVLVPLFVIALIYTVHLAWLQPSDLAGLTSIISLVVPIVPASVLGIALREKYRPPEKERTTEVFSPVGGRGEEGLARPLPREEALREVSAALERRGSGTPVVVFGPSGVGKSVVVSQLLLRRLGSSCHAYRVLEGCDGRTSFKAELRESLLAADLDVPTEESWFEEPTLGSPKNEEAGAKPRLLVFDQFEQFVQEASQHDGLVPWFHSFVAEAGDTDLLRTILVIRDDYLYGLHPFRDLFEPFQSAVRVSPVRTNHGGADEDAREAYRKFRQLDERYDTPAGRFGDIDTIFEERFRSVGEVLPLEIEMAGYVLEDTLLRRPMEAGRLLAEVASRSVDTLVERYFDRFIDRTPDQSTAESALFALSAGGRVRSKLSLEEIGRLTHRSSEALEETIAPLQRGGLVKKSRSSGTAVYQLAHDFLVDAYRELSAERLDPVIRDNISYFVDVHESSDDRPSLRDRVTEVASRFSWSYLNLGVAAIGLLFLARLGVGGSLVTDPALLDAGLAAERVADLASRSGSLYLGYLPALIAGSISTVYVYGLYSGVFLQISDRRLPSTLLLTVIGILLIGSVALPHLWLALAGLAGLCVAGNFWLLSLTPEPVRRVETPEVLGKLGSYVFVFMLGWGILGTLLAGLYYLEPFDLATSTLFTAELLLSVLYFVFMVQGCRMHATRERAARILSTYDRMMGRVE